MKISIITVCLNSALTIEHCIQSVLSQTYPNIEYIIIDGLSNDGTQEIVSRYLEQIAVFSSESDNGIYDAMNRGLEKATGDYIIFLNADDYYSSPKSIEILANHADASRKDCYFGDVVFVSSDGNERIIRKSYHSSFRPHKFKYGFQPAHPTFFAKKELFDKYGGYNPQFRIAGDFDLMCRFLLTHRASFYPISQTLVAMRHGGMSTGGIRTKIKLNREIRLACRLNNLNTNYIYIYSKYFAKVFEYLPTRSRLKSGNII